MKTLLLSGPLAVVAASESAARAALIAIGRAARSAILFLVIALLAMAASRNASDAAVLHTASVSFPPTSGGPLVQDRVIGFSASDIDTDILAEASDFRALSPGNDFPGGALSASVGRSGALGLQMTAFGTFTHIDLMAMEVLIASDEFVNVSSFPARVISHVIVDGGSLAIHGGQNVMVRYVLSIGILNRGQAAQHPGDPLVTDDIGQFTVLAETAASGTNTKMTEGRLIADANRELTFEAELGTPDSIDLNATFNPAASAVHIPTSVQTLDFGLVGPGDRVLVAYSFELTARRHRSFSGPGFVNLSDVPEGIFANYSDPFSLSAEPAFSIEFVPVPEPKSVTLLVLSGAIIVGRRRRQRERTPRSFVMPCHFGLPFLLSAIVLLHNFSSLVATAGPLGPAPYGQPSDSPFATTTFDYFYLEDFEDGQFNVPGVTKSTGRIIGPGPAVDSVDADDGMIDGSGNGGRSLLVVGEPLTFTFDALAFGRLPTHAGFVRTDGGNAALGSTVSFEAFGPGMVSLGTIGPTPFGDGISNGGTAEDRFFGWFDSNGILAIQMPSGVFEVDHLQYGAGVPEPGSFVLVGIEVVIVWLNRRRRTYALAAPA